MGSQAPGVSAKKVALEEIIGCKIDGSKRGNADEGRPEALKECLGALCAGDSQKRIEDPCTVSMISVRQSNPGASSDRSSTSACRSASYISECSCIDPRQVSQPCNKMKASAPDGLSMQDIRQCNTSGYGRAGLCIWCEVFCYHHIHSMLLVKASAQLKDMRGVRSEPV